jgi:hypothetical protein
MKHQDNTLNLIFSIVDDFCKLHLKKNKNKLGPHYQYSDSKILKMIAIKYLSGIESDRSLIRILKNGLAKGIFRGIPDQSSFNRRSKELAHCLVEFQRFLTLQLGTDSNPIRILDSTPIPVVSYLRSNRSSSFPEASYGYCAAKREKYFGFKLHLAVTPSGIPTNFDLTPANISDGKMTEELIELYDFLIAIGDKGYLDKTKQQELERRNKKLITPYRKNQNKRNSEFEQKLLRLRKRVETVFSQFKEQMHLNKTRAKSLIGLVTRVLGIITSFTLGMYINSLRGNKLLKIKGLLA